MNETTTMPPVSIQEEPNKFFEWCKKTWDYLINFRWVIDLTHWMLGVGGTIAHSAFLVSTTYIIINLVAHKLVLWLVLGNTNVIDSLNQFALIAFCVLPELIVVQAITKSLEQWKLLFTTGNHIEKVAFAVWAIMFTIPTVVFVIMTVQTINGFVSIESAGLNYQLSGDVLRWRVTSGWVYGATQMLYAATGKGMVDSMITNLRTSLAGLHAMIVNRDSSIVALQQENTALKGEIDQLRNDLLNVRVTLARTRTHTQENPPEEPEKPRGGGDNARTRTHTKGMEAREKLKSILKESMIQGGKVNIMAVYEELGVTYNTALKYHKEVMEELAEELSQDQQMVMEA